MSGIARHHGAATGLFLPALLLAALCGLIVAQAGILPLPHARAVTPAPATTIVAPRAYSFRDAGDFQQAGLPIDPPLISLPAAAPLEIMTYQVSTVDYQRCVDAGACERAAPRHKVNALVPVTGVSFTDATAYASWLSVATGDIWRLPTYAEWTFAAGTRAPDDALNIGATGDPSARWLAFYEQQTARGNAALAAPSSPGSFGVNEFGIADLAGSVWEWTSSCGGRTSLDAAGAITSHLNSCGVRILAGRHAMSMNIFVRDAVSGGCSVGAPPDNLGFRLVRQRAWYAPLADAWRTYFG